MFSKDDKAVIVNKNLRKLSSLKKRVGYSEFKRKGICRPFKPEDSY